MQSLTVSTCLQSSSNLSRWSNDSEDLKSANRLTNKNYLGKRSPITCFENPKGTETDF